MEIMIFVQPKPFYDSMIIINLSLLETTEGTLEVANKADWGKGGRKAEGGKKMKETWIPGWDYQDCHGKFYICVKIYRNIPGC